MSAETMTKGDFATLCNVDPSRVSHWIRDGKISGEALIGKGSRARIVVDEAQRQLRMRMDSNQRTGNGLKTRLHRPKPVAPAAASEPIKDCAAADLAAISVCLHTRDLPVEAAMGVIHVGGTGRQAYFVYRTLTGIISFNHRLAFKAEPPVAFELMPWDNLEEDRGIKVGPDDLAAWDAEWDRQYDEPEEA